MDRKVHKKKKYSIFQKMFIPIFFLMVIQSFIFFLATEFGGVEKKLNKNASDIFNERVINRKNEIETVFNSNWTNMSSYADIINSILYGYGENYKNLYLQDMEFQKQFLKDVYPTLITMLRNNGVNGVYLVLNDNKEYHPLVEGEVQEKYGLCLRDMDQNSAYKDKEDILIERSPSSLITEIGCSLDSWWEATFQFEAGKNSDFYYKPLEAAYDNFDVDSDNLAYFSSGYHLSENDKEVVSYGMPLLDKNGIPYAVLGVEITTDYLKSLLPSAELGGQNKGVYALVQYRENENEYQVITYDGILYQKAIGNEDKIIYGENLDNNCFRIEGAKTEVCGVLSNLKIYNDNTPFETEYLAVMGIMEEETLFAFSDQVSDLMLLVTLIPIGIGFVGILCISHWFAAPITKLAGKVREMKPEPNFKMDRLGITEIDQLVDSLEALSHNVSESQARTEFFSRMSHDMRTPMNAIIGFSSSEMLENSTEEQKVEYLDKINGSAKYLLGLINEILDINKIESQKMELNEKPSTQRDMWGDVLPIIDEVAAQKNVIFEINLDNDDTIMMADGQRLSQIFVNLLSNAVKFTPSGGKVTLSSVVLFKRDDEIVHRYSVKDTGVGMSVEFQARLYQPFAQENPGREGTGLGLSIAKKLVELMGGTIKCESKEGKGTEFIVILTNKIVKESIYQESALQDYIVNEEVLKGKRILLCEDHPLNTQIARKLLEKKDIIVEHAENGQRGVELIAHSEENYFDAILMDIRMPVMSGLEAAKAIRELDRTDAKHIPIIAMTANALADDIEATGKAGMNAHLSKPINPQLLYGTLSEYLK